MALTVCVSFVCVICSELCCAVDVQCRHTLCLIVFLAFCNKMFVLLVFALYFSFIRIVVNKFLS